MKKQTAVEWLFDWMGKNQYFIGNDLLVAFEQAKAMEREQITTFAKLWESKIFDGIIDSVDDLYDKTYGGEQ